MTILKPMERESLSVVPKRPKFGGFRSPLTTMRRSYEVGDRFQRLGNVPWHLESMNTYLSRCQAAALGALMS
jgi:hypothetical protein